MNELEELKKEMEDTIKNDPKLAKILDPWWMVELKIIAINAIKKKAN